MSDPGLRTVPISSNQSRAVPAALLAVLLGLGLACTTWRPATLTPESFPHRDSLREVRITLAGGRQLKLQGAQITPDSLRGMDIRTQRPMAIPLSDIERVQTHHVDAGRTVGLFLIVTLAAAVALGLAVAHSLGAAN
jgi:hypothetical protein